MDRIFGNKRSLFMAICVFLVPALLLFIFTVFLPIIWSSYYSFFNWDGINPLQFVGFDNYKKMFLHDDVFRDVFFNNIIYVLINTVFQIILGLGVALILTAITKGKNLFKTLYFVPCIISSVAMAQLFMRVYSVEPVGIINGFLQMVGLESLQKAWAAEFSTALVSVSVVEVYRFIGLYMLIFYAALVSIPSDVIEAATIDGAKGWKLLRYIKLPLISNVITITFVMVVNGTLKGFDIPWILTYGAPGHSTELMATYMYKTAFSTMQYGYGSAIAVFLVLESFVAIALIRKAYSN